MGWRKSEFPTRNRGPVLWILVLLGFNVHSMLQKVALCLTCKGAKFDTSAFS